MKTSTIVLIVGAGALAYVVWRGQAAPAANPGTVLAPAVGAPVAAAPPQAAVGSETAYTTVKTSVSNPVVQAATDLREQLLQMFSGGNNEGTGGA